MLEFFFCSKGWLLTGCLTVHVQAVLTGDPLKLKTFEMLLLGRVKAREGTRMKVEGGGGHEMELHIANPPKIHGPGILHTSKCIASQFPN